MTSKQLAYIRARWQGQFVDTCSHLSLELECNDEGDSTDNYVSIVCGELAAQRQARSIETASLTRLNDVCPLLNVGSGSSNGGIS